MSKINDGLRGATHVDILLDSEDAVLLRELRVL